MGTITIKDIAKRCQVGVSTVSRAMNDHPDINPKTKKKILKVIEESGYVPDNSARNLKRVDARAVAVLIKGIGNTFFNQFIEILEQECQKRHYSCVIQRVEEYENEIDVALQIAREKKLRGVVFLGGNFSHSGEEFGRLKIPYVLSTINSGEGNNRIASVSVDDFKESYKMTDYLLGLGHKRIAIITARKEDESIGKLRLLGYQRALSDQGIQFDEDLVCYMKMHVDRYSYRSGYKITKELLSRKTPFTALYATSDTLAVGAIRALFEAGIHVPDDCSVAGFDGMEAGEFCIPGITTIRQPAKEIARATADLLFSMIDKKEEPKRVIFDGELIIRESTAISRIKSSEEE
ncbi:LacI family DNA-binding transcriptional regulator [Blautia liquoris]|uniref:LacI family DNA-binding transcriptional regulator n=1 Tax=Blautia liquoris TaxID=2779518 RepID=A0A7M2RJR0_9FIRM|nr:LacI family DNA-binding transcriptional regulator [Blautia liquoris]QOV19582.1 LacI family DNA-binding transcriptional regulator [Blautia liquoris]